MAKKLSNIQIVMRLFNSISADEAKTLIDVAKAVMHERFPSKPRTELKIEPKPKLVGSSISVKEGEK